MFSVQDAPGPSKYAKSMFRGLRPSCTFDAQDGSIPLTVKAQNMELIGS